MGILRCKILVIILITGIVTTLVEGQTASCGERTVGSNPTGNNQNVDTNSGSAYVTPYKFECCGVVKTWSFYPKATGTIKLQVWEDLGARSYKLKGEDSFPLLTNDQINKEQTLPGTTTVTGNDVIGWTTSGTDMISYKSSTSTNGNFRKIGVSPSVGSSINFGSGSILNFRTYGVTATTADNSAPRFVGDSPLPQTVTAKDTRVPFSFYTVEATDDDVNDVSTLRYTITSSPVENMFKLDLNTKRIQYRQLSRAYEVGTFYVTVVVEDQCENSVTGVLTIIVENTPPDITSLAATISMKERETFGGSAKTLHSLRVVDLHTYSCYLNATTPSTVGAFTVTRPDGAASNAANQYTIYNSGLVKLNPGTYQVHVSCVDEHGGQDHSTLTVVVEPNLPPSFTKTKDSITVDATVVKAGDVVYTPVSTDPESDTTFCSNFSCTPTVTCPFEVSTVDCKVRAKVDLNLHKIPNYDMNIWVNDGLAAGNPMALQITIDKINDQPVITNLPVTDYVEVSENSPANKFLYKVSVNDDDVGDTITLNHVFIPEKASNYFKVDEGFNVRARAGIDYESLERETFQIKFTANDGREDSVSQILNLKIIDVNEPQTKCERTKYTISGGEKGPLTAPGIKIIDPDDATTPVTKTDTQKYTLDCGAQHETDFIMDPSTGLVTVNNGQYDLDKTCKESETIPCVITATDLGDHTVKCDLEITINEINENPPVFGKENYDFTVPWDAKSPTTVGQATTTDLDCLATHDERQHLYELCCDKMFSVRDNGQVYLSGDLTTIPNYKSAVFDLTLTATDRGDLAPNEYMVDSVPVTITVVEPPTTTTSTTTTTTTVFDINNLGAGGKGAINSFFDVPENLAWFVPCMILLAIMLALLAYMIWRICRNPAAFSRLWRLFKCNCDNCCKQSPKKIKVSQANYRDPARTPKNTDWNLWSDNDFSNPTIEYR